PGRPRAHSVRSTRRPWTIRRPGARGRPPSAGTHRGWAAGRSRDSSETAGGDGSHGLVRAPRAGRTMAHQRPILRHRSPPAAGRDAGLDHPATTDREPDGAPRTGTGGPRTAGRAPDSQEVPGGVWDTGPMNDASQRHADRYGGPLVSRRTSRVLLAVAAAVFLAVVVYVGMQASNTPVRSEMLAYEHVADDVIAVD